VQHTLGSLKLEPTDDEFDLFAYLNTAIEARETAENGSESLKSDLAAANVKVTALERQLKDLTEAKLAHENALLSKFSGLINSKKLKIRDQQRLLTTSHATNVANSNNPHLPPNEEHAC
jgi:hypothetical protein